MLLQSTLRAGLLRWPKKGGAARGKPISFRAYESRSRIAGKSSAYEVDIRAAVGRSRLHGLPHPDAIGSERRVDTTAEPAVAMRDAHHLVRVRRTAPLNLGPVLAVAAQGLPLTPRALSHAAAIHVELTWSGIAVTAAQDGEGFHLARVTCARSDKGTRFEFVSVEVSQYAERWPNALAAHPLHPEHTETALRPTSRPASQPDHYRPTSHPVVILGYFLLFWCMFSFLFFL